MIIENKTDVTIYVENEEYNSIYVGYSEVILGEISNISKTAITLTGGIDLTSNLEIGQAVKFESATDSEVEIRRVLRILDTDLFIVSKALLYDHVGQDAIKEFSSNDSNNTFSQGGTLSFDEFENPLSVSEFSTPFYILEKCITFQGATSVFIYDDSQGLRDRQESFIFGTYDDLTGVNENVYSTFIIKPNATPKFIVNMKESVLETDDNYECEITDFQGYVYSISLNGSILSETDYSINSGVLTINSDVEYLQTFTNYVRVLHYADQTTITGYKFEFKIKSFDDSLLLEKEKLELNYSLPTVDSFSSSSKPEYYSYQNNQIKQYNKIQINQANTLNISYSVGSTTDSNEVLSDLRRILEKDDFFRIILYNKTTSKIIIYYNCRISEGKNFQLNMEKNSISITVDYSQRAIISNHLWGSMETSWGDFNWGLIGYSTD